jgi:hypothetical protein
MKTRIPTSIPGLFLILTLVACNLQSSNATPTQANPVATSVEQTFEALTQAPVQTLTAAPSVTAASATPSLTPTPTATLTPRFTSTFTPTFTLTKLPTNTPIPKPGTIAGNILGYPYGSLPALTIVAYGQDPPYYYSYIISAAGSSYYSMSTDYLIPGLFQVVAYDAAGHAGGCPGLVTVISEQTVTCNISDWSSSFRSKPADIPSP